MKKGDLNLSLVNIITYILLIGLMIAIYLVVKGGLNSVK